MLLSTATIPSCQRQHFSPCQVTVSMKKPLSADTWVPNMPSNSLVSTLGTLLTTTKAESVNKHDRNTNNFAFVYVEEDVSPKINTTKMKYFLFSLH